MENDYEHKISRLEAIETDVQRVLDFLAEQQTKKEGKTGVAFKTSPAGPRAEMVDASCETLITSANFDFDEAHSRLDREKVDNFFKEGIQRIRSKKVPDFSVDLPEEMPEVGKREFLEGSTASPVNNRVLSPEFSVPSHQRHELESPSKKSSPRLEMLQYLEEDEDGAAREQAKQETAIKRLKKAPELRLNIKATLPESDGETPAAALVPQKKVKPVKLNDSWDDMKSIKASSYQAKRSLQKNENILTSDHVHREKEEKALRARSSNSIRTSSSSSSGSRT